MENVDLLSLLGQAVIWVGGMRLWNEIEERSHWCPENKKKKKN